MSNAVWFVLGFCIMITIIAYSETVTYRKTRVK